jgi:hypothetical protein
MPNPTAVRVFTEDDRKHLELIQNVIDRLAGNSASLKRWTVLLALGGFGLGKSQSSSVLILAAIVVVAVLGLLDTAYLADERRFRELYRLAVAGDVDVFTMVPPPVEHGYLKCLLSWSVLPFYATLVVTGTVALHVSG